LSIIKGNWILQEKITNFSHSGEDLENMYSPQSPIIGFLIGHPNLSKAN